LRIVDFVVVVVVDEQEVTVEFKQSLFDDQVTLDVHVQLTPHSFPIPQFTAPL
jgi:hypothetical protein